MRKNILFVIVMLSQSFTDMICVNNDNPTPQSDCLRGRCRPLCPACVKEKLTPQMEREKEPEMKETLADLINRVESDERERRDDDKIGKEQTAFQLVMNKSLKDSGQGALLGALFFLFGRMLPTTVKLLKKGSKKGKICLSRIMSIAFLQKDVNSFSKLSQKEVDDLSMKVMGISLCGAAVGIFIKVFSYPISSKIYRNTRENKSFFSGINRYDFNLNPKVINEIFEETIKVDQENLNTPKRFVAQWREILAKKNLELVRLFKEKDRLDEEIATESRPEVLNVLQLAQKLNRNEILYEKKQVKEIQDDIANFKSKWFMCTIS